MKIAVIGAGSTYTPELVKGFLDLRDTLALTELVLMDIQPERLAITGGLCQRIARKNGSPFDVRLTSDRADALTGAAYVITQIRVGFLAARREDEYLGQRHGIIGQETTGVGGMAKALRTIPVILDIAADMRRLAPGALLVNFTNPSGLVTEALFRHAPDVPSVGLCNSPITMKMKILQEWEQATGQQLDPAKAELDALGVNHLCWYRGFRYAGQDLWPQVLGAYVKELSAERDPMWEPELVRSLGMIPNYYLEYYYNTAQKLEMQAEWPPSRADTVIQIEAELLRQYADPALEEPPPGLMQRGGAYYSTLATQVIHAHHNNLGQVQIVNVRQDGAVVDCPADWVMELPCRIDAAGIHPLPAPPLPEAVIGLLRSVKAYELLTVEAAVTGSRRAAFEALLAHPLGPKANRVSAVLDDLLKTNRAYLPDFWVR